MFFDKEVILFDVDVKDKTDAETKLANHLRQAGVVTEQFKDAVLQRESNFPTGLQTETIGVAIPHTDAYKVITPQIGFMRLKNPVTFNQMGDNAEISVSIIFMLALKKSDDQLTMLQKLMGLFQNKEAIDKLEKITSKDDFVTLMKEIGIEQ